MNRIIEDRLLLDECEIVFVALSKIKISNPIAANTVKMMVRKIETHKDKFTRKILDKELYIRKNKELFDAIYERESKMIAGSFFEQPKGLDADKCEKKICDDLVEQGFYSVKTGKGDVIRSLMKTYRKIFDKE